MSVRPTVPVPVPVPGTQKSHSTLDLIHVLKRETTIQNAGKVSELITDNATKFLRWIYKLQKKEFAIGWRSGPLWRTEG
jgi:hypothetical protein